MKVLFFIIGILTLVVICRVVFYSKQTIPRLTPGPPSLGMLKTNIPKIIYRTFGTQDVSKQMHYYCHELWVKLNPDYRMIWFSNDDCTEFLTKYDGNGLPEGVLDAYNRLRPGAFKADLWRLCILHYYGGIYIDAFATPFISIDEMMKGVFSESDDSPKFVAALDPSFCGSGIHNGFILASRGHPFILECIHQIIHNVKTKNYGDSVLDTTGPSRLRKAVAKVLGVEDLKPHPGMNLRYKKRVTAGETLTLLPFYLFSLTFNLRQMMYKNDKPILSKKYSAFSFFYEKFKLGTSYHLLWKTGDVFE